MRADFFVLLVLFIYMPCHFFEEAMGNFPLWMSKHWTPYHLSYGHWMANNNFLFYPLMVISYLIHYFMPTSMPVFGCAMLVWGIINSGDHIFYTIKDRKISAGLWTGFIYLINSVFGFYYFSIEGRLTVLTVIAAVILGAALFAVPCILSKSVGNFFMKRFGMPITDEKNN